MIYAGSPALDDLRYVVLDEVHYLQDAYRGPVWEEVIIHLPRGRSRLVCLSATVSNAEELADWIATVRGATDGGDRGAAAGRARTTSTSSATRRRPTCTSCRRSSTAGPTPRRSRLDAESLRAPHRRRSRPRRRFFTPGRVEVVERLAEDELLPAIYFIFSRAACDDAAPALRRRRRAAHRPRRARAHPRRSSRPAPRRSSDADLDVLGYDRWLAGARGRHRRPPRRHGAAVQGGGRGLLRRGAGQGGVRHRDARPRHQHAGPDGRHREAHEVHRRAPRVPHAGRVHAADRAGRPAGHRRRRLRRRAVVAVRPVRPGGGAGRQPVVPAHVGVPADLQHGRQPGAPLQRRARRTTSSTCRFAQYQADRSVVSIEARLEKRRQHAGRGRGGRPVRPRRRRGVPAPWSQAAADASRPPSPDRARSRFALAQVRPGDVLARRARRGSHGKVAVLDRRPAAQATAKLRVVTTKGKVLDPRHRRLRRGARGRWARSSCRCRSPRTTTASSTGSPRRCSGRGSSGGAASSGDRGSRGRPSRGRGARAPGRRLPRPRRATCRPGPGSSGCAGRSTTCSGRSGAAPSRWPAGSTGCCACSRRGATSTAGRSPTRAPACAGSTTSATC